MIPPPVDPNKRYPNPSFGLDIWGPLIPANDCRTCLYTLSGLQLLGGLYFFWLPQRIPRDTPHVWRARALKLTGMMTGFYLMFLSGLELVRLQLPYDPWQVDAAAARAKAEKQGEKVSWWFGPRGYRPVEYSTWKERVDGQFEKGEEFHKLRQQRERRLDIARTGYTEIRERNREVSRAIIEQGLTGAFFKDTPAATENEKQKHAVFEENTPIDDKLERTKEWSSEGKHENKGDDYDEEERPLEWEDISPWDDLKEETDVQIRLIPHSVNSAAPDAINVETKEAAASGDLDIPSAFISIEEDDKKEEF